MSCWLGIYPILIRYSICGILHRSAWYASHSDLRMYKSVIAVKGRLCKSGSIDVASHYLSTDKKAMVFHTQESQKSRLIRDITVQGGGHQMKAQGHKSVLIVDLVSIILVGFLNFQYRLQSWYFKTLQGTVWLLFMPCPHPRSTSCYRGSTSPRPIPSTPGEATHAFQ